MANITHLQAAATGDNISGHNIVINYDLTPETFRELLDLIQRQNETITRLTTQLAAVTLQLYDTSTRPHPAGNRCAIAGL